jgi:hypothetical protein
MTIAFLFLILCQLPDFDPPSDSLQQVQQKDECDFTEYKPIRISDYKVPIKKRVEPEYPKLAVDAKIAGAVVVKVLIDLQGNVIRACAGKEHPLLKQAAIEAALQWKFIRNCKNCFGRKTKYMEEFIVFKFDLNIPTRPSNNLRIRAARGAHPIPPAAESRRTILG